MAMKLVDIFSHFGKSISSLAFEDTLYFYDRDKPWTFGILNQIL
jgi:hypothetical protein